LFAQQLRGLSVLERRQALPAKLAIVKLAERLDYR
jgi:hypothetical protein